MLEQISKWFANRLWPGFNVKLVTFKTEELLVDLGKTGLPDQPQPAAQQPNSLLSSDEM